MTTSTLGWIAPRLPPGAILAVNFGMATPQTPRFRDRQVRQAVLARLTGLHHGESGTRIVQEMGLAAGAVRVDVAVINGVLHGYEIKSPADTLSRLPEQAAVYSRVCDRVTIVTAEAHLAKLRDLIPSWWGVWTIGAVDGEPALTEVATPGDNPTLDPYAVAQLLWRDEALQLLEEHGLAAGLRSRPRSALWRALAEALPLERLGQEVRSILRNRPAWRADSQPA